MNVEFVVADNCCVHMLCLLRPVLLLCVHNLWGWCYRSCLLRMFLWLKCTNVAFLCMIIVPGVTDVFASLLCMKVSFDWD